MIITLCGSTRFKDEFMLVNRELTLRGYIVLMPGVFGHADGLELTKEQKAKLDELHLRKIDMSTVVYIINKNRYIGSSTTNEIQYAVDKHKPIWWLEPKFGN